MHKLIISLDTYYWIKHCSGTILQDANSNYELLVVYKDIRNIFWCRNLCFDSIYEQRKFDLFRVGKELGIKKASNLLYEYERIDIQKFITELTLYILLNNIKEVYFQNNIILSRIFKEFNKNYDGRLFAFGNLEDETKRVVLDEHVYHKKIELRKMMVGINNKKELDVYRPIERFCEIK